MAICIPPKINRKLKEAISSGELKYDELFALEKEQREVVLEKYLGKQYAKEVSTRFSSKFNTELSDEVLGDVIDRMTKITELRAKEPKLTSDEFYTEYLKGNKVAPEWAREYVVLQNNLERIVNKTSDLGAIDTLKAYFKEEGRKIADQTTTGDKILQTSKSVFNIATSPIYKSLKASIDLSYALRQGFKVFTKSPSQWGDSMREAFKFVKAVGSKSEMDALMSEFKALYYAHPNYEKLVGEGKLAFGIVEDWFPTSVAEKLPSIGNMFKSSNDAFTVFSQSARFGIANDLLEKYTKQLGRELTKEEVRAIGTISNSITGRGGLGKLESISGALNKLFFSARYVRSQIDTFAMPFNTKLPKFAREEAMKHSATTLGTVASLITVASFFGDVETDPRSTKFGKLRLPDSNTYIDLTAGLGSYITLAVKQATGESKSSTSGRISKLNTGEFGSQTRGDVLRQWATNKLAPAPGAINQIILKGETFEGEEPTILNTAKDLTVPISIENLLDLMQTEDGANIVIAFVADVLGLGTTTYSK